MASLYEIEQRILECCDCETGEIVDPELLDALLMERDQKIENVALWIVNLESDALAYKTRKEAFAAKEKASIKKAEALRKWLAVTLDGQKFSTADCTVSFRRSERVEIENIDLVPKEYMVEKVSTEPDKAAIKNAIKSGVCVCGCKVTEHLNAIVK